VLSPSDPLTELGDYLCFAKQIHWLFCKTCGVRCFAFMGEGEITEQEVPLLKIPARDPVTGEETGLETIGGKTMSVWSPKKEGWKEGVGRCYLALNAHSLDAKQEGLDLREWAEKKWICYLDGMDETGEDNYDKPHVGGTY
jgi:hypothetical protein